MRTLAFVLFYVCSSVLLQAQYVVINVKESVYADEKLLQKKDKLSENVKLRFSSADAFVYVMSPGKGYFVLGIKDQKKTKGEFILALKDALLPPNEYHGAVTRNYKPSEAKAFEDQYDLMNFFRDRLFFVAPAKFKVAEQNFPLDSNHYFIIRHHLADGWIEKILPHADQTFEISPAILQLQDKIFTEISIQQSELLYVNGDSKERQRIGMFKVQFVDNQSIEAELRNLYDSVKKMPAEQFLLDHALPYLNLVYGNTQLEAIRALIQKFYQ
ncbi:MAG: hypothetical protein ACK4TA_13495 [Saprospiraceae bacterium]